MTVRRSYGSYNDGCASAHALDLIGERWALIIVRELILGAKRFADLQRDIPGIGPPVLTQRLRDLETTGIVIKRDLAPPASGRSYELTAWGQDLEDVNAALSAWAVGSPRMPFEADMSPDTLVLAMRAHARPSPRRRTTVRVRLSLTDSRVSGGRAVSYLATIAPGGADVVRSHEPGNVDAEVRASTRGWKSCVIAGTPLDDARDVHVSGNRSAAKALLTATRLGGPRRLR